MLRILQLLENLEISKTTGKQGFHHAAKPLCVKPAAGLWSANSSVKFHVTLTDPRYKFAQLLVPPCCFEKGEVADPKFR